MPLDLLHRVVVAGDGASVAAAALEALVVRGADAQRSGAAWLRPKRSWPETFAQPVAGDERGYEAVDADEAADAVLTFGPARPAAPCVAHSRPPARPSAFRSPRAVAAFAFADEHFDASTGPLTSATAIRV